MLVVPFFAITIIYRVLALSLIFTFAGGQFGVIPLLGLLFTQVRSVNYYVAFGLY